MTPEEIYDHLQEMEERLCDRGYVAPQARFAVKFLIGGRFCCWLEYRATKYGINHSEHFHADDAERAIRQAEKFISDLPTVEDTKKSDFLTALGRVIDQGRDAGVDVDFLNPLTETMKRLSENVITHVPLKVVGDDDDMPF